MLEKLSVLTSQIHFRQVLLERHALDDNIIVVLNVIQPHVFEHRLENADGLVDGAGCQGQEGLGQRLSVVLPCHQDGHEAVLVSKLLTIVYFDAQAGIQLQANKEGWLTIIS